MEDDVGEAWKGPSVAWNRTRRLQGGSRIAQGSSGGKFGSKVCVECVSRGFELLASKWVFVGWVALHVRKEGLKEWRESRKGAGHGRPS